MKRSIRVVVTAWYLGILSLILLCFAWFLYARVASNLFSEIDRLLLSQADAISDSIYSFCQAEHESDAVTPAATELASSQNATENFMLKEIHAGKLEPLIRRWAAQTHEFGHLIRIIDPRGSVIYVSRSFDRMGLPFGLENVHRAKQDLATFETYQFAQGGRWRLLTYPVSESKELLYFVQTPAILRQADASLIQLRFWLLILIPILLLLAGTVGWALTSAILEPVERMVKRAQSISMHNLHERIQRKGLAEELDKLAKTFNDMLERIEISVKQLRQFSAAASHELRTPLAVLKGELEVALRKPRSLEDYRQVLETQLQVVTELSVIVEQLLILAYTRSGEEAIEWKQVDLKSLLENCVASWGKVAVRKDVRLALEALQGVSISGERGLLTRLFSNLLDNAIKHTPGGGIVTLRLFREGPQACIEVTDTGQGIAHENLTNIFDRFFVKSRPAAPAGGYGIGLGLCRWIAQAHHGNIQVRSQLGQGTTFTVLLPAKQMNEL